ncbi:hypothetical protein CLAIMM_02406 isoform 1 [Cladophialophora immunda]|nr:hypothetical protein CLAIMM_02406 isoform 1 [Cladophialophora immunda]
MGRWRRHHISAADALVLAGPGLGEEAIFRPFAGDITYTLLIVGLCARALWDRLPTKWPWVSAYASRGVSMERGTHVAHMLGRKKRKGKLAAVWLTDQLVHRYTELRQKRKLVICSTMATTFIPQIDGVEGHRQGQTPAMCSALT